MRNKVTRLLLSTAGVVAVQSVGARVAKAWADSLVCPSQTISECVAVDQSPSGLAALDSWCQTQNPSPAQCKQMNPGWWSCTPVDAYCNYTKIVDG
jgi:hypothetical protein